jgi:hypothetical protein
MSFVAFVLGSVISSCSMVTQFGMSGVVFHNDVICRQNFNVYNTSDQNEVACEQSLANLTQWKCDCRSKALLPTNWIRISNDGSVAMASLLFIFLFLLSFFQCMLWFDNLNSRIFSFSSFEAFSVWGFFVILFVPNAQIYFEKEKTKILTPLTVIVLLYDFFTIGLVFQYSSNLSVFEIVTLIACGTDILLRCLVSCVIRRNNIPEEVMKNCEEHTVMIKDPPAYK